MRLSVRFAGQLRILAERHSMNIELAEGASLRQLLGRLQADLPASFSEKAILPLLRGEGPWTLLLVNRNHIQAENDLDCPLAEGDIVAFVPPMEGG